MKQNLEQMNPGRVLALGGHLSPGTLFYCYQNTSASLTCCRNLSRLGAYVQGTDIFPDIFFGAVSFDLSGPTFRHEMYPKYKANRESQPEDITIALPYIKNIITNLEFISKTINQIR